MKIFYDIGKSFQIQDGCQILTDLVMIQVVIMYKNYTSVLKMIEQYKLTICVRLMW